VKEGKEGAGRQIKRESARLVGVEKIMKKERERERKQRKRGERSKKEKPKQKR
jgi:hypothetical protein